MKRFKRSVAFTIFFVAALSSSHALAQISWVKVIGTNPLKSSGTSIAVTVPAGGVAAGNSIIVSLAMDPASGTVSCTCPNNQMLSHWS